MRYLSFVWKMIVIPAIVAGMAGCNGHGGESHADGENVFEEAVFIKGMPDGEDRLEIVVRNPWDSTGILADYMLVNGGVAKDDEREGELADKENRENSNKIRLELPLKRLIVYSSVHAALLAELGYADAIAGVADAAYIKTPEIVDRLKDGRITDIGSSMEPSLEKIISLDPDAILISPYQNAGHGVVDKAGIPVIECADYMETTPLGRAEWSKFYAMLVEGIAPSNGRIFEQSRERYNLLAKKAQTYSDKPKVVTEWQSNGNWLMPGGRSYAGQLLVDAGATYPFADNKSPGSIPMNYEKAFMAAQDADFWLLKSFGEELTLEDVARNHPLNRRIWAYSNGGIYYANTATTDLFEETPFHPDLLLADYVTIFHQTGDSLRYYTPVRPQAAENK